MPELPLQPRQVAAETNAWLQNVYCWLWAGRLRGTKNPTTGCWEITRADLEKFKKLRKAGRGKTRAKKSA